MVPCPTPYRSAGADSRPVTAVAAATAGDTRWVRPPLPWRPSKFLFEVEADRSPGLSADLHGTGDDEHPDAVRDLPAADHVGGGAQVLDPAVGAGADEHGVDRDLLERRAGRQAHVGEGADR